MPAVNEVNLRGATYTRDGDDDLGLKLVQDVGDDGDEPTVPFAIWDPDQPDVNATRYSRLVRPIRVTLDPGDFLYLPAMW